MDVISPVLYLNIGIASFHKLVRTNSPFIIGLLLGVMGYLLLSPANKKLRESRSKFIIRIITADQIVLLVQDEKMGNLLKAQSKKWKKKQ